MKKKNLLFFYFLFLFSCSKSVNEFDLNNEDGVWTRNGKKYTGNVYRIIKEKKIKLGKMKKGIKIGQWIEYGRLIYRTGNYNSGQRTGKWEGWYEDSKKAYLGFYSEDLKTGLWEGWNKNGNLSYRGFFKDGIKDSSWIYWYENGNVSDSGKYSQNNMVGYWKFYNTEGILVEEKNFDLVKGN